MKRFVLAAAVLSTLAAPVPALAQYYGGPSVQYYEEDYGPQRVYPPRYEQRRVAPPRYEERRVYVQPRRDYYTEGYDYAPRRAQRQARLGSVCVTARGSCPVGGVVPINTPCGCQIPGFGPKRGAVGY
jgi:hypothetical protein